MSEPTEPTEPTTEHPTDVSPRARLAAAWRDPRQRLALLGGGALVAIVVVVLLAIALAGGDDDGEASERTTRTTAGDRDGDTVPDDEDADPDDPEIGRRTTTTRRGGATTRTTDSTATTAGGSSGTGPTTPGTVQGGFPVPPTTSPGDPVLENAYARGFTDECNAIFGLSPNGRMFDPETPDDVYSAQDCLADMYPEYGNDYSTPEAAAEAGRSDAIDAVGLLTALGRLCWGDDSCWDWENAF